MKRFLSAVDKTIEVISATITIGMIVLVTLQIIMRYVFKSPLIWSEELARFDLVLLTFFGSSLAMSQNEHIYVSIVVDKLKGNCKNHNVQFHGIFNILRCIVCINEYTPDIASM